MLKEEIKNLKRMKEKLLTKNGVLFSQRLRITEQIKLLHSTNEVTFLLKMFYLKNIVTKNSCPMKKLHKIKVLRLRFQGWSII